MSVMAGQKRRRGEIQTLDTAFDIVETIRERNGSRVTPIAEELGLAKSTVSNHLTTLHHRGYLVKEGDTYHLGMEFLGLGEAARTRLEAYELAGEKVRKIAAETNERCQFIVEEHGHGSYVYREAGPNAVLTDSAVGGHVHLHSTAAGKAILAFLPEEKRNRIVDQQELPRATDRTITDPEELLAELSEIRDQGYATNQGESTEGLWAIGAPVILPDGRPLGAISISAPAYRMKGERFASELPDLLLGIVNELELNITYS